MTTRYRTAASVAEARILELSSQWTNMPNTKIIKVPHLGGIDCAYQMPKPYDSSKPTLCLVNSFTTSSELYQSQYANKELNDAMNLIAIELLGHGQTRTKSENFTYWDTAIMNLQALEALGMLGEGKKTFVLGTSQGGWITVRMALLAPDKVRRLTYRHCRSRLLTNHPRRSLESSPSAPQWTTNPNAPAKRAAGTVPAS